MVLEFPGFAFDQEGAEALARALRPQVEQALTSETAVSTVLGALYLSAAAVIQRSGLRRNPAAAANAGFALTMQALREGRLPW